LRLFRRCFKHLADAVVATLIDDLRQVVAFLFGGCLDGEDAAPVGTAGMIVDGFEADEGLIVP